MYQSVTRYLQRLPQLTRLHHWARRQTWLWALPALAIVLLVTTALRPNATGLQRIFDSGTLRVVTRHDPAAFYTNHHGPTGFDYELAKRFATSLGLKLKIIQADNMQQLYQLLAEGKADVAAAALTMGSHNHVPANIDTSRAIMTSGQRFVYRLGEPPAKHAAGLRGHSVAVLADSDAEAALRRLAARYGDIIVDSVDASDSASLLRRVSAGKDDYALVNNQSFSLQHPLYPELDSAFSTGKRQFVWAFAHQTDPSFKHAVNRFLTRAKANGTVRTLAAQFYGKHNAFNLYAARVFIKQINQRLPSYSASFYQAAQHNHFDWRLLAAISYQESHWNPAARSPTGVRGMMMLTQSTAQQLDVDRNNPAESIKGGARYLRQLEDRLPAHIKQPNRIWLAIAAYNIGMGHLEDARVLTQSQGGNPDSWADVRRRLPLLAKSAYGKYLQHGRADGPQAVAYVSHIRHYYKLLVWAQSFADTSTQLALAN